MRSQRNIRWLAIPALVAGVALPSSPAWAQTAPPTQPPAPQAPAPQAPPAAQSPQTPFVGVVPATTSPNDPNKGQWFFIDGLQPGQVGESQAKITNPADVPQTLKLYLADMNFAANGGIQVADQDKSVDIGSWGGFGPNATITIPPKTTQVVPFSLRVPQDAEPGDHVGSVVVEEAPAPAAPGDNKTMFKIVKRVATRLYVTLPGEARAAFSIEQTSMEKDSDFFTKEVTTKVVLHNTGRVRLRPNVLINGQKAHGSDVLLSSSVENYFVTQKVPIYGGPVSARVDVHTKVGQQEGPTRQTRTSVFVIPWVLLAGLVLLVGFFFGVRRMWRRRGGKYAAIQADLRRFEKLLDQQRAAGVETTAVANEAELAIKTAIKQAGRSGDKEAEIKLRGKLAELREQEVAMSPPPSAPTPVPSSAPVAGGGGDVPPASPPLPAGQIEAPPAAPAPPAPAAPTAPAAPAPVVKGARDDILPGASAPAPKKEPAPAPAPEPVAATPAEAPAPALPSETVPERTVAVVLRELAAAPPGAQRFALIREARAHGLDVIESHSDELQAIPEDLRSRLLRSPAGNATGNGNGNGHGNGNGNHNGSDHGHGNGANGDAAATGDREAAPQGSEIA